MNDRARRITNLSPEKRRLLELMLKERARERDQERADEGIPTQSKNIEAENIEDSYRLSPVQLGMLFYSLYDLQSGLFVQQLICALHENLVVPAFTRAWQRVVERHPVFRTSFHWENLDEPLQKVSRRVGLPLEQQDWRGLSVREREDELQAYLETDRRRGFEFTEAPLMRLALLRVAEADWRFVWTSHHALLDGRSRLLILKEVFAFYEAYRQNRALSLPRSRPYGEYIEWLHQQDLSEPETFWRRALRGFTAPTPLVVDPVVDRTPDGVPRPGLRRDENYGEQGVRLSAALTSELRSMAQRHGLTLNTLTQGAWALLLSRYSGEEDVVFGATRACRRSALEGAAEDMVGLFINTLPVRVRVSPETPLLPWMKRLRTQHVAVREHEHTPLAKVQGWSEVPKGQPLFESSVVFENYLLNFALQAQGGSWEKREFELLQRTNQPLVVYGYAGPEFPLKIGYDRRRFGDGAIARMLLHLEALLEGMAADPEQRLADVPL